MSEQRGAWYLLTGVVAGVALGLLVAWVVVPIPHVDTTPATLRSDFKDEYRYMIAAAYSTTGNLARARARLGVLGDKDPVRALGDQAQGMLANNASQDTVRILGDLSQALQGQGNLVQPGVPTVLQPGNPLVPTDLPTSAQSSSSQPATDPGVETPTSDPGSTQPDVSTPDPLPVDTVGPLPTHTATSTPGAPFVLGNRSTSCDPTQPGLLQVNLKDANGQPVAGMQLVITWLGGEEDFFTGLKPELGNGYADFVMAPDVEYTLTLSGGATRVTGLTAPACNAADGSTYIGGIHLDFAQP